MAMLHAQCADPQHDIRTVRFFPHDVTDLSFLLDLLSSPSDLPSTTPASEADRTGPLSTSWELRYCLLLWLSVCIRLPFSFRLLAPGAEDKIRHVGLRWLRTSGKESDAAAQVVGRYFSRDDVDIVPLLDLCEVTLSSEGDDFIVSSGMLTVRRGQIAHSPPFPPAPTVARRSLYRPGLLGAEQAPSSLAAPVRPPCAIAGSERLADGRGAREAAWQGRGPDRACLLDRVGLKLRGRHRLGGGRSDRRGAHRRSRSSRTFESFERSVWTEV